jgi:hypothetical protein
MNKAETTSIIISEGLDYVRELNSLYVKALDDAAEMFCAITGVNKGDAFVMFFGDSYIRLEQLVESLRAVREMAGDLG